MDPFARFFNWVHCFCHERSAECWHFPSGSCAPLLKVKERERLWQLFSNKVCPLMALVGKLENMATVGVS